MRGHKQIGNRANQLIKPTCGPNAMHRTAARVQTQGVIILDLRGKICNTQGLEWKYDSARKKVDKERKTYLPYPAD